VALIVSGLLVETVEDRVSETLRNVGDRSCLISNISTSYVVYLSVLQALPAARIEGSRTASRRLIFIDNIRLANKPCLQRHHVSSVVVYFISSRNLDFRRHLVFPAMIRSSSANSISPGSPSVLRQSCSSLYPPSNRVVSSLMRSPCAHLKLG
jgi:hypothetical protein